MPPLHKLSYDSLLLLTKLTGGAAALVLVALFVSGASLGNFGTSSLSAAVVCSGGTTCTSTSSGGNVSLALGGSGLTTSSGVVNVAANVTGLSLTWPIPPAGVQDSTDFNCYGNGAVCDTFDKNITNGGGGYPTVSSIFTDSVGDTYLVGAYGVDTTPANDRVSVYKWVPGSTCFGKTTCADGPVQNIRGDMPYAVHTFSIGSNSYLAIGDAYTLNTSLLYQWMPSLYSEGSGAIGNSTGGGNNTTVDRSWQINNSSTVTKIGAYSTASSTIVVKIVVRTGTNSFTVAWSQFCSHPGNGWYDCMLATPQSIPSGGTYYAAVYVALGSSLRLTNNSYSRSSVSGDKTGTSTTSTITDGSGTVPSLRVIYQTAVSPTGCFGDGVQCADLNETVFGEHAVQLIGTSNWDGSLTYGDTAPTWTSFVQGTDTYLLFNNLSTQKSYLFKWMVAGTPSTNTRGCFGNGTACGNTTIGANAYQTIGANNVPTQSSTFVDGSNRYLVVPTVSLSGSANAANTMNVFKWTGNGANCPTGGGFGSGTACATTTAGVNTYQQLPSPTNYSTRVFQIGSSWFLFPAAYYSTTSPLYKWIPSGTNCPGSGASPGFGTDNTGTPTCGTSAGGGIFQSIGIVNPVNIDVFTNGANYFLAEANDGYIYKWMPTGGLLSMGCFGNGGTCAGAADGSNTFAILGGVKAAYRASSIKVFNYLGVPYLTVGSQPVATRAFYTFKPVSIPCFGNGTNCGVTYQSISSKAAQTAKTYSINNTSYLAVGPGSTNRQDENNGKIFQWMSSGCTLGGGWGDGTTCGTALQTLHEADTRQINYFTYNGKSYLAYVNSQGLFDEQSSNLVHLYQWMPGAAAASNNGAVRVSYFNGQDFQTPVSSGTDTSLNHYWWTSSPASGVSGDHFTIRWEGGIQAPVTGTYSFHLLNDDGARVWIDGNLVFDVWGPHDDAQSSRTISGAWTAGSQHSVLIEYQEFDRNAGMELTWSYTGSGGYIDIPSSAMYQNGPVPASGCWGDGYICFNPYQRVPRSELYDGKIVIPPGLTIPYLVTAGDDGVIYEKWTMGTYCPADGGFGNGTTCSHDINAYVLGQVANGNRATSVETSWVGSSLYLTPSLSNGTGNVTVTYKWIPGSNCFGDGTTCDQSGGTHYTQITSSGNGDSDGSDVFTFDNNGTTSLAYTSDDNDFIKILRWNSSGTNCPGWGTGTSTCSLTSMFSKILQGIAVPTSGSAKSARTFAVGSELFLLAGVTNDTQGSYLYRWIPSKDCFGDGINCAARSQTLSVGDTWRPDATTTSGGSFFILPSVNGNTVNIYKYTAAGGVVPGCTLSAKGASDSAFSSVSTGDSNSTGFAITPTEDTDYKLECTLADGSVENTTLSIHVQTAPIATITASATQPAEPNTNSSFTISVDQAPAADLPITYTVSGSASATTSADYTPLSGTATILAGQTSVNVVLNVSNDAIYEGSETVVVTLSAPGDTSYAVGTPDNATLTIADDENGGALPSVTFAACTSAQTPDGTTCQLKVTPTRVRSGTAVLVTWYVSGLITGEHGNNGDTCSLTRTPTGTGFPPAWAAGSTWSNLTGVSSTITQQTRFTLTCSSPNGSIFKTVSQIVGLVPSVQEI